ncbi:MAG: hypothetical protein GX811_10940, partial [Lentisphaerae bacterium]|nr:hypothetical protein [Lentisphaerota bacterium]
MKGKYALEVRNPRSVRESKIQGLTVPRIQSIEGKKIALFYTVPESHYISHALCKLMQEKFPTATVVCKQV